MSRLRHVFGADGLWTGRTLDVPEDDIAANLQAGHVAVPVTDFPHAKKLIDGKLEDFQPPPPEPSADHEWDATERKWQRTKQSIKRDTDSTAALEAIRSEELASLRALREWALSVGGGDAAALANLRAADDSIKAQRPKVKT
jgi:hypothetical protein